MALTGSVWEAFLKLWNGDEEAARRWLEEHPEARNRSIEEAGLITRDQEPEEEADPETSSEAEEDEPEAEDEETPTEEEEETVREMVLDDSAVEAITSHILGSEPFTQMAEALAAIRGELEQSVSDQRGLSQRVDELTRSADERLVRLEREDDQRHREWVEDLPAAAGGPQLRVSYRPREQRAPEDGEPDDSPSPLDVWQQEKQQKGIPSY